MLLGPNRRHYFLLTGEKIGAHEAKQLGVVGKVLHADALMARARTCAAAGRAARPDAAAHTGHTGPRTAPEDD